jgi:hypothetical protein
MKSGYYEASETISLAGSMSDVEVTKLSGLLELNKIEQRDDIMADKGFTVKKDLRKEGCNI